MTKKIFIAAMAALFLLPSFAPGNGLNLNGLGSRAQGMGGAFVGIADDFSAVFWNPAGAAGFRQTTFGFTAVDLMPRATYSQRGITLEVPEIDAKTKFSHYLGGLAAYYKPIGSRVVVGLGIGTPSSQGIIWDGSDFADVPDGPVYDRSRTTGVFAFSPLVAVKLNEWLSVGAAINVNLGTFSLKGPSGNWLLGEGGEAVDVGQYEENMNGWGFGATFGVLVKPIDKLGIGLSVRTRSTISYNGTARLSNLSLYGLPDSSALERKITWPLWIAGGVSFRPLEGLLLSADVQWTQWSKIRPTTSYLDPFWQLNMPWSFDGRTVFGLPDLFWKNSTQLRLGVEYTVSATTAFRAGYYNDPAPGPFTTMNLLLPTYTYNALSLGVGRTIGDLQLDFGLEYLAGKDRSNDMGVVATSYGMSIVVPSVSVGYKF